jgi:hypothetical protein
MPHDPVTKRICALIEASGKSQVEIAEAVGYPRANIIAMFKMGATKVPIAKVGLLAKALDADPAHLTRLALETYTPGAYDAIRECLGELVSRNELEILGAIRSASENGDPKLSRELEESLSKLFAVGAGAHAGGSASP